MGPSGEWKARRSVTGYTSNFGAIYSAPFTSRNAGAWDANDTHKKLYSRPATKSRVLRVKRGPGWPG